MDNDDELEQGPIVEDDSLLATAKAILDAMKSMPDENPTTEDTENTPTSPDDSQPEENNESTTSSGEPVDGGVENGNNADNSKEDNTSGTEESDEDDGNLKASDDTTNDPEEKQTKLKELKEKLDLAKDRKNRADKFRKGLKENSQKNLKNKITQIFNNPASTIFQDIKDSTSEIGKNIKKSSQKAKNATILKPHEKAEAIVEVSAANISTGTKQTAIETGNKIGREALKKGIELAAPWSYIIIAVLVGFCIALFLMGALSITASGAAAGTAASTEAENMTENYSITSENFYGIRTAYIDEDVLANSLQQSYKQYVIDILEDIDNTQEIDITISLPEITTEKPFTNFTEVDAHITNISLAIANTVATGSTEYSGIDFASLYPQISYFGLTQAQVEQVNNFIDRYLVKESLFVEVVETEKTIEDFVTDATNKLTYIYNICEKVMIKDHIADESGLKDVEQLLYLCSIYMPNKDITITDLSTAVTTTTPDKPVNVKVISKNANTISTISTATTNSDDGKVIIDSIDDATFNLSTFTSIDASNTQAFAKGVSLFEALRLGSKDGKDYSMFFQKQLDTNDIEVYTWMPNCENALYITYESTNQFIFTDLDCKLASLETNE